jgi:Prophage antirepressor
MSELLPFDFDGNAVRVVLREDAPWFVAKDVCQCLGIVWKGSDSTGPHLDDDEWRGAVVPTPGGPQKMSCVSESGLYALIFTSRKPEARRFRRWVTGEVLPSIRSTGGYGRPTLAAAVGGLPSGLRAKAMHAAVQAVRLTGGTEADIERLFVTYCGWLSMEKPRLPAPDWTEQLERWISRHLDRTNTTSTKSMRLYEHFKGFLRGQGWNQPMPSVRVWGEHMNARFRRIKSGGMRYYVSLREDE